MVQTATARIGISNPLLSRHWHIPVRWLRTAFGLEVNGRWPALSVVPGGGLSSRAAPDESVRVRRRGGRELLGAFEARRRTRLPAETTRATSGVMASGATAMRSVSGSSASWTEGRAWLCKGGALESTLPCGLPARRPAAYNERVERGKVANRGLHGFD